MDLVNSLHIASYKNSTLAAGQCDAGRESTQGKTRGKKSQYAFMINSEHT